MSLEAKYRTEIVIPRTQLVSQQGNIKGSPCFEILRLALEKVIKDRGGIIDNSYSDNEGKRKECLLAMHTGEFSNGIGVNVEKDGKVVFLYDALADKRNVAKYLCNEIVQNYAVIAIMRAQKKAGFEIKDVKELKKSTGDKLVVVTGVR